MACVLSEGSNPSVPMIFVAISISFSFESACREIGAFLLSNLRYNKRKEGGKV